MSGGAGVFRPRRPYYTVERANICAAAHSVAFGRVLSPCVQFVGHSSASVGVVRRGVVLQRHRIACTRLLRRTARNAKRPKKDRSAQQDPQLFHLFALTASTAVLLCITVCAAAEKYGSLLPVGALCVLSWKCDGEK